MKGLLLINLGTPNAPTLSAVRHYLKEFLADPRVISIPAPLRYLLLYGVILPFRTRKSTHAYQSIWTDKGSPLLCHSHDLVNRLQKRLKNEYKVVLGMRYGTPSLKDALLQLQECSSITVLPLYPQYSSAATGSSIEKIMQLLAPSPIFPSLKIIRDFHDNDSFISAQSEQIKPYVASHDYILFSYHGVPESHIINGGCQQICVNKCPSSMTNNACYRAQCQHTTALIAKKLNLNDNHYSTSFQSRLGRTPWIKPYTDRVLNDLINQGIKSIAVVCPSFVADCLETLEEIGIQAKEQWTKLGGEKFTLIPCLNKNESWVDAIISLTQT